MTINTSSFFMLFQKPYAKHYTLILLSIFAFNYYVFITLEESIQDDIKNIVYAYFIGKFFLIIANFSLPFKFFHYNKIIFDSIIAMVIGLLIFFSFLNLYENPLFVLADCALCLLSVFSLLKMHHYKNARKN